MAERIYDQTMGQLAGVEVTTTGNSTPTRNGLEAYAQMVVSGSGQPISSTEGSGNLVDLSGATVASGSLSFSANAQYAIIDTQGFEGASFTVSGFGTATLAVQWSNLAASGFTSGTVSTVGSSTTGTTITGNGQYTAAAGGRYMKILVTAFTTGPIVVTPVLIAGSSVGGGGASGAVNITQVAGSSVTAAAGAVAAGTLRTTLASDDPAVVALQAMQAATGPVLIPSAGTPVKGLTAAMTGTASTAVTGMGAPGSGLYNYITAIVVGNSDTDTGTFVELQDGNGGTTFWTLPANFGYGGCSISFPTPLKQPTSNTALYVKNTTTGANVIVSVVGYTGA